MSSQYWLICVPNEGKNELATRKKLDERTERMNLARTHTFRLPDQPALKVGTIDQLMQLSDELGKIDSFVEATVKKIERTCIDLVRNEARERAEAAAASGAGSGDTKAADPKAGGKAMNPGAKPGTAAAEAKANAPPACDLTIERVLKDNSTVKLAPEKALEEFAWDMRRYHSSKGIGPLADLILKASSRADDELKNRLSEYNELKQNVSAIERKEGGSLLVRPLGPYVRKNDIFECDNLTTLLVVVPRVKEQEFLNTYEFLESEAQKEEQRKAELKKKDEAARKDGAGDAKSEAAAAAAAHKKKQHALAVQARREADEKAAHAAGHSKESEEDAKRKDEERKRDEDERMAEQKRRDEELNKKRKEDERRYACWNVVPGSAKKLTRIREGDPNAAAGKKPNANGTNSGSSKEPEDEEEDIEFVLYRVVVMRKGADSYRNLLRDKRYTVRAFKYDPEEDKSQKDKKKLMDTQKTNLFRSLVHWCNATFSDIFSAWLHIKAMRIFVEAVLRYGLPIDFQCVVIKPKKGLEKKVREVLNDLYSKLSGDSSLAEQLDAGETDLSGMGADFYPYVYLPIMLTENVEPNKQA